MVDVAPFGKIVKTHDSTNLHYGTNINLEQLELARFVVPFRLPAGRLGEFDTEVKTKNRKANIRPCGTNMFYLLLTSVGLCLIRKGLSNFIFDAPEFAVVKKKEAYIILPERFQARLRQELYLRKNDRGTT